jgi:hypothetical protein
VQPKVHAKYKIISSVKLYREDLDAMLAMFKTNCESITISDADFVYESLDDLRTHVGQRVRNIDIAGTKPTVVLRLVSSGSELHHRSEGELLTQEETDRADLLFTRVKEFLLKRRTFLARLFTVPVIVIICAGMVITTFILSQRYLQYRDAIMVVGMFGAFAFVFLGGFLNSGGFRYVTLDSKANASSFWARNRDDMIKLVIGTVIGIVSTLIVQYLSHHFR